MKIFRKHNIIILLFLVTIITSCTEDNMQDIDEINLLENKEMSILYKEIIGIEDLNEQKLVVSSFDVETQYILWQLKLKNFIEQNKLTNEQQFFIKKLRHNINISNLKNSKS